MLAAKIAIVLAISSLVSVAIAETDCTQSNGYKYSKCGKGDAQTCCKSAQKCVEVKSFSGADLAVCSEARQLSDTKAVKIVIIPVFFMLLQIVLIAYLVLRCNIKERPTAMLCVVVIAISWPFLFSKYWTFGAYTMLLAAMVACASASTDFPKMAFYAYRFLWALVLFQVVALLGPFETFHVPLFGESNTATNLEVIKNVYGQTDCNDYYKQYFKILDIEKEEKDVNPDVKYFGYCSESWLATVQSFAVIQGMLWMVLLLLSGRDLLAAGSGDRPSSNGKVFVP